MITEDMIANIVAENMLFARMFVDRVIKLPKPVQPTALVYGAEGLDKKEEESSNVVSISSNEIWLAQSKRNVQKAN